MIEITIRDYLEACGFVAVLEKPQKPPLKYVLLEKTSSSLENHINYATFAIQSYAPSMYEAAELNENVKAALLAMPDTEDISRSALNSDYNFTDETTKEYRYQAVFDFVY